MYEIYPVKDDNTLEVHTQDDTLVRDEQANEKIAVGDDTTDNQKVTDSGEADQTPPMTNVESKKVAKEVGDEKGEDAKKGQDVEMIKKEKDGDKIE